MIFRADWLIYAQVPKVFFYEASLGKSNREQSLLDSVGVGLGTVWAAARKVECLYLLAQTRKNVSVLKYARLLGSMGEVSTWGCSDLST